MNDINSPAAMRRDVVTNLPAIMLSLNRALTGQGLKELEGTLQRLGRGQALPHWHKELSKDGTLPNLDGKTIGSIVEMLLAAVIEVHVLKRRVQLKVNPARGVDFPDLELSVKAPSENFCTSEPFFSAYERIIGSETSALILLTNYQSQKVRPPLRLQILKSRYLEKTQIADRSLCLLAAKLRQHLDVNEESRLQRMVRFLAFVNQSDWRAKQILKIIDAWPSKEALDALQGAIALDFSRVNLARAKKNLPEIPATELAALHQVFQTTPTIIGLVDAADNWCTEAHQDFGRLPNSNEWQRFLGSPLDGQIGMSFALQWRYNFSSVLGGSD